MVVIQRSTIKDECATVISEFHVMRYDHAKNFTHPIERLKGLKLTLILKIKYNGQKKYIYSIPKNRGIVY